MTSVAERLAAQLAAERLAEAQAALTARGLVPYIPDPPGAGERHVETMMWALQVFRQPREWDRDRHDPRRILWTTPEMVKLMAALNHAQKLWVLMDCGEIAAAIGLSGLRAFDAAWRLDAEDTDLGAMLDALADEHKALRARSRKHR